MPLLPAADGRSVCRQKVRKKFEREKCPPPLEVLSVKRAPLLRQLVLPLPNELRILVPSDLSALRHGIVQGRQRHVLRRKQHAEAGVINEKSDLRHCFQRAAPVNLVGTLTFWKAPFRHDFVASNDDRLLVFAEDSAECVGDFADRGVGLDGSEDRREKIFRCSGAALEFDEVDLTRAESRFAEERSGVRFENARYLHPCVAWGHRALLQRQTHLRPRQSVLLFQPHAGNHKQPSESHPG